MRKATPFLVTGRKAYTMAQDARVISVAGNLKDRRGRAGMLR